MTLPAVVAVADSAPHHTARPQQHQQQQATAAATHALLSFGPSSSPCSIGVGFLMPASSNGFVPWWEIATMDRVAGMAATLQQVTAALQQDPMYAQHSTMHTRAVVHQEQPTSSNSNACPHAGCCLSSPPCSKQIDGALFTTFCRWCWCWCCCCPAGIHVNSKTRKGMNPLMLAAAAGHTEAVDLLLKRRLVTVLLESVCWCSSFIM